jgi:hypothetical protein
MKGFTGSLVKMTKHFILLFILFNCFSLSHGLQVIKVDEPGDSTYVGVPGLIQAFSDAMYAPEDPDVCIELYGQEYVLTSPIQIAMSATTVNNLYIRSAYGSANCVIWGCHTLHEGVNARVFSIHSNNLAADKKVSISGITFRTYDTTKNIIFQNGRVCSVELTDNVFDTYCRAVHVSSDPFDHEVYFSVRNNVFIRHLGNLEINNINWSMLDFNLKGRANVDIIDNRFENAYKPLELIARGQTTTITGNEFHSPHISVLGNPIINRIIVQRPALTANTNHPDSHVLFENNLFVNIPLGTDNIDTTINDNTFWITDDLVYNDAHDIIELSNLGNSINHAYTINANVTDNLFRKHPSALTQINGVRTTISSNNSLIDLRIIDNSMININRALVIDTVPDAPFTNPTIVNNIFSCVNDPFVYGCSDLSDLTNPIIISHSVFQNGFPGDTDNFQIDPLTCYEVDPLIVIDNENRTYTLTWTDTVKSPCINNGYRGADNEITDPDGTPPDIGCVYYPHVNRKYFERSNSSGIYWTSFPVIDDRTTTNGQNWNSLGYVFAECMVGPPTHLSKVNSIDWSYGGELSSLYYQSPYWYNTSHEISPLKGYKVQFNPGQTSTVVVNGFKADAGTTPAAWVREVEEFGQVRPFENWIGYYVPYTQKAGDALSKNIPGSTRTTYLDFVHTIKTQTWSICRMSEEPNSPWLGDPNKFTLSEGDMVVLMLLPNAPQEMYWNSFNANIQPIVRPPASAFVFEEKLDYTPVYIELDPNNLPDEVGVFVDGVCKGATVVDSSMIDVCFYNESAKESGDLEIMFYYGGKGKKVAKGWKVYNADTMVFEDSGVKVNEIGRYAYISFNRSEGESPVPLVTRLQPNYPNPFNPSTTISFVLSREMNAHLEVYNIRGQKVLTLHNAPLGIGRHSFVWNGKDQQGRQVSSGIYFSRLSTPEGSFTQKMMLMK